MIKFKETNYNEREVKAVQEALMNEKDYVSLMTQKCEQYYQAKVFLCANASLALDVLLCAYNFKKGSEVIIPSYTYPSAINSILRYGLVPILCDIDPMTCVIDLAQASQLKTAKTVCVIPTHYGGVSCDMDLLKSLFMGVKIIEDAALSLGAYYKEQPLGSVADASILSFHKTKNISCDEGGAIVLKDPSITEVLELIYENGTNRAAFMRNEISYYSWKQVGINAKLSNINAAILSVQWTKITAITKHQAKLYESYRNELKELSDKGIFCPQTPQYNQNNYHVFYLIFQTESQKEAVRKHLNQLGIEALIHYQPLHTSPFFKQLNQTFDCYNTEHVAACLLRLPMHTKMRVEECKYIAREIIKVCEYAE